MGPTPSLKRRRLLAAGVVTVITGGAGCNDATESVNPGKPISQATANTSVLVRADMTLLDHDGTEQLLEAYGGNRSSDGESAEDISLVTEFENRTGLEADTADVIVIFADEPHGDFASYVIEGEWTEGTVVESIESATGLEYEARDHEGGTVYEPTSGGDDADYLGYVAEGRYAIGSGDAVEAAIGTVRADRESASGLLVDAFEDATDSDAKGTTYLTAATDAPRAYLPSDDERVPSFVSLDVYEKADVATVSYTADGSRVTIDAEIRTATRSDARDIADFTFTVRTFLQNNVAKAVAEELSKIEINQQESVVTVGYRSDVEGAATLAGFL